MSKTTKTKATKKTGEALRKEALAVADANLAAIEAEQQAASAGIASPATDDGVVPLKAALRGNKAKTKAAGPRVNARKNAEHRDEATPKGRKGAKEPKAKRPRKVSALDAAAQVLAGSKHPLGAKDMIAEMQKQGLWTSPGGKTPHATVYAAIIREIAAKGKEARFIKTERGLFAANRKAGR